MDKNKELKFRQKLIIELNGFKHNLYRGTYKYIMTQQILTELKRTEIQAAEVLCKYADYFEKNGIAVLDILYEVI